MIAFVRVLCDAVSPVHISRAPRSSLAHANTETEKNEGLTVGAIRDAQGAGRPARSLWRPHAMGAEEGEQRVPTGAETPVRKFSKSANKTLSPSGAADRYPDHSRDLVGAVSHCGLDTTALIVCVIIQTGKHTPREGACGPAGKMPTD